jgi:quercetin dioxygenase-like cupin family protein
MCTLWVWINEEYFGMEGDWFDIAIGDLHELIALSKKQSAKWQITEEYRNETQVLVEGDEK